MDRQKEGALQQEQDIEALIRRLPGLSTERCPCPYVNVARALFNREQVIKALWPEYVDDAVAVEVFVVVICCLNLAIWWCQHKHKVATTLILQLVSRLLACRQTAGKRAREGSS